MSEAWEVSEDQIQEVCELAQLEPDSVRKDYSGRGMYGKECVGFVLDTQITKVLELGAALHAVLGEVPQARVDNMGFSQIVYFPGMRVVQDNVVFTLTGGVE